MACTEKKGHVCRVFMWKPEENGPVGIPKRRLEDDIRWILKTGWQDADWINLAQDRDKWPVVLNTVMNLPVP